MSGDLLALAQNGVSGGGGGDVELGQLISIHHDVALDAEYIRTQAGATLLQTSYDDLFAKVGLILTGDITDSGDWADAETNTGFNTEIQMISVDDDGEAVTIDNNRQVHYGDPIADTWTRVVAATAGLPTDTEEGAQWLKGAGVHFACYRSNFAYIADPSSGAWTTAAWPNSFDARGPAVEFGDKIVVPGTISGNDAIAYADQSSPSSWTTADLGSGSRLQGIATDGVTLCAVGLNGSIWTATDAAGTWTQNTAGVPNTSDTLESAAYGNGYWVAAMANNIWYASDPTGTWTKIAQGVSAGRVAYSAPTEHFVFVSGDVLADPTSANSTISADSANNENDFSLSEWGVVSGGGSSDGDVRAFQNYTYNPNTQFYIPPRGDATTAMRVLP